MDLQFHPLAKCCWCQQPLVKHEALWWCPTAACRERQRKFAVGRAVTKGPQKGTKIFDYLPTPKQVEFDACDAKYVLYGGAAGPGKSHAARWALYRRCLQRSGFEALLLRKTYPELEKTHLRRMAREAPLVGAEYIDSKKLMRFPNGSLIECGHMEDADAVAKYLSTEYDVIAADEGSTFDPNGLLELSTRSVDRRPGGKFWVVSNPGGPASSMLLDFFVDHQPDFDERPQLAKKYKPQDWVYIPGTLDDNPYIDEAYEASLAVLPKWRYEQLRHGDWHVFSGQFFAEWNERVHVASLEPARDGRWFRSLDWGRNQPGCVLWWTVLADHKLYIRREWKFQGMSEAEVALGIRTIDQELRLDRRPTYTAADPSIFNKTGATHTQAQFRGQSIGESLNFYGVSCTKGDNDRFNGWMRCHALLRNAPDGAPWLQIHPDCRYLTRSIAAAVSDKNDPDDVDTKTDDHALDAWRYGAMSRPNPATKRVVTRYAEGTMGWERQQADKRRVA